MILKDVRIRDYRSIENSGEVPVDLDVTCLVGKNESGKTAFLQSLHLLNPLNPINGKTTFDEVMDYPSRKSAAYKKTREASPATVVRARFELEEPESAKVRADLGPDALTDLYVTVSAGYSGSKTYSANYDDAAIVKHLSAELEVPSADRKALDAAKTVTALRAALDAIGCDVGRGRALRTRVKISYVLWCDALTVVLWRWTCRWQRLRCAGTRRCGRIWMSVSVGCCWGSRRPSSVGVGSGTRSNTGSRSP